MPALWEGDRAVKIFLAASKSRTAEFILPFKIPFILESFYYIADWQMDYVKSPDCKMFLLDSGAFTFMNNAKNDLNFERYLYDYIEFINKHDVRYFFELDIDSVVGLSKVEEYREILERETGKKCIPVWHKSRGKQYFLDMVREYDYVAIGGIVTKEIKPKEHRYFPWFINEAHKHGAKIHGLGFTNLKLLHKYRFDSVDSTSWLMGARSGTVYRFDGQQLRVVVNTDKMRRTYQRNFRIKHWSDVDHHNLGEWVKYVWYMYKEGNP